MEDGKHDPINIGPEPSDEVVAEVIGDAVDSMERLRLLVQEADQIARTGVNNPYLLRPGHERRLLACTSAAINLLHAISVAGIPRPLASPSTQGRRHER